MMFGLIYDEARKIWCYRWLALITAAVIFGLAALKILSMPPIYDGWGQIFINDNDPVAAATRGVSLDKDEDDVIRRTILNDKSLERVVLKLNPAAKDMDTRSMMGAIGSLRSKVTIEGNAQDNFLEFHYRDQDPARAQLVAQTLMDQFVSDNRARSQSELARTSKFLDDQIAAYEKTLLASQVAIAQFRRANPAVARLPTNPTAYSEVVASGGGGGGGEGRVVYQGAEGAVAAGPAGAPQDGAIAALQDRIADLRTQYTDQYPDVLAARRQLATLQAERAAYVAANPAALAPAAAGPRRVVGGGGGGGGARTVAAPILPPDIAAQWSELLRKDELLGANYQQLIARREATNMSMAMSTLPSAGQFQITREATLPLAPIGPNKPLYLAAALIVALGIGIGAAYLRGAINGIFVSPRELEEACQLPVIGTVSWEPAWHTGTVARANRTLPIVASLGFLAAVIAAFMIAM